MEEEPRLPGSEVPTDGKLPLAYIYQPSPSAMQSALTGGGRDGFSSSSLGIAKRSSR